MTNEMAAGAVCTLFLALMVAMVWYLFGAAFYFVPGWHKVLVATAAVLWWFVGYELAKSWIRGLDDTPLETKEGKIAKAMGMLGPIMLIPWLDDVCQELWHVIKYGYSIREALGEIICSFR